MNNRAKNYHKAYKLTESYYINTNPILGLYKLIKWLLVIMPEKEFVELCKRYKAGKFDFKEE